VASEALMRSASQPHACRQSLRIARSGSAFLGLTLALGRVAAPASRHLPADISGQVFPFVGLRAAGLIKLEEAQHLGELVCQHL
jgi:hypothetical protein